MAFRTILFVILLLLVHAHPTKSEPLITAKDLAVRGYFHVTISGTDLDDKKRTVVGKAFAIDADSLLTAGHVVDNKKWQVIEVGDLELRKRTIGIQWMKEYGAGQAPLGPYKKLFVTPAAGEMLDAARLEVRGGLGANPLQLNACPIEVGSKYSVLINSKSATDATALDNPQYIELKAPSTENTDYGELYTFLVQESYPRVLTQGDSGSPVVNKQGEVVGLLSAIVTKNGQQLALVTLTESLLSLVPNTVEVECHNSDQHKMRLLLSDQSRDSIKKFAKKFAEVVDVFDDKKRHPNTVYTHVSELRGQMQHLQRRLLKWSVNIREGQKVVIKYEKMLESDNHVKEIWITASLWGKHNDGTATRIPVKMGKAIQPVSKKSLFGIFESKAFADKIKAEIKDGFTLHGIDDMKIFIRPVLQADDGRTEWIVFDIDIKLDCDDKSPSPCWETPGN